MHVYVEARSSPHMSFFRSLLSVRQHLSLAWNLQIRPLLADHRLGHRSQDLLCIRLISAHPHA